MLRLWRIFLSRSVCTLVHVSESSKVLQTFYFFCFLVFACAISNNETQCVKFHPLVQRLDVRVPVIGFNSCPL